MRNKLFLILSILLFCGCADENSKKSEENVNNVKPDSINQNIESKKKTADYIKPYNVKVYLENSASMAGYNSVDCENFTSVISQIVSVYGRSNTTGYFYSNKLSKAYSADDFAEDIAAGKVKYGDSSPLHVIIDSILKRNESLSFLVTDGIISGTNQQIKNNREYNRIMASELQLQISNIITAASNVSDIACSIYKFESNFNGLYYCYNNDDVKLENVKRPFFVVVLGAQNHVRNFADRVETGLEFFRPSITNQIHFGIYDFPLSGVKMNGNEKFIANNSKNGECTIKRNILRKAENENISIRIDIAGIPNKYFATEEYIKRNSKILLDGEDCNAQIECRQGEDDLMKINIALPKGKLFKEHILQYKLEKVHPGWITMMSSDDDKDIKNNPYHIFKLSNFINAFNVLDKKEEIVNSQLVIKII